MDESVILATRNIKALHEGLKHFEAARVEDSKRVEQLMQTVSMQTQQIQALQQSMALLRAKAMGSGPTGGN